MNRPVSRSIHFGLKRTGKSGAAKIFPLFLLLVFAGLFNARPTKGQFGDLERIEIHPQGISLFSNPDVLHITVCSPRIIEFVSLFDGIPAQDTLVAPPREWPFCTVVIDTVGECITLCTAAFLLEIDKKPIRFRAFDGTGRLLFGETAEKGWHRDGLHLVRHTAGSFYGLHNRRQGALHLEQGGEIAAGSQGGAGAPFVWTPDGWGLVADSDGGRIDLSPGTIDFIRPERIQPSGFKVYFLFGQPRHLFAGLAEICGRAPLFPRFSLGFLNTEWGMDEEELRRDVDLYRQKNIPLDAYVLDFDWMDWGNDNYGEFRWGEKFPGGPSSALAAHLDSLGVRLMGIRKPRIHLETTQGRYCSDRGFFVDSTRDYFSGKRVGRLNFHLPAVRSWFWDSFYRIGDAFRSGIVGYWNDEADEYGGNLMFMQMQRSQYEGQRAAVDQRVWSINRNFYLGAQRYAYALWSGDIGSGFASMAEQRLFMLSSIALGAAWWGMDIGGFHGTPSPENYYRWMQFGAFVPVFRVHGSLDQEREPWNYGAEAERIAAQAIRLRYRLLPYIYSAAWRQHTDNWPLCRPLVMDYPTDPVAARMIREWMFGDDLLVCPVLQAGATRISVYLPAGVWIDFFTGDRHTGPAYVALDVHPETIPLFVRGGAVVPQAPVGAWSADPRSQQRLDIVCYPGGADTTLVYEDDGLTYANEHGSYATTELIHVRDDHQAVLEIGSRFGPYPLQNRKICAQFVFVEAEPDSIFFDNRALAADSASSAIFWDYDARQRRVQICFPDDGQAHRLSLDLAPDLEPPTVDSVECRSADRIWIRFSESVMTGAGDASAENPVNYAISGGVRIEAARAEPSRSAVLLQTSPLQQNQLYTLSISGIADRSRNRNQMSAVELLFKCRYVVIKRVELQDGKEGYSGTCDSHIAEYFPDNNMGKNPVLEAGRFDGGNDSDDKSILIRFDLDSAFSDTDSLLRAELVLDLAYTRNGTAGKSLGVYRVLTPWEEGTRQGGIDGLYAG
ncbi:DUF5110 domain-containing protein, partial [candidate division KSB1 bacterium]|nr:DUF5110 domain-containing protein [candidate division KSB1 bacterium]